MSLVYILILIIVVPCCWLIGSGDNSIAAVAACLFVPAALALYFAPTLVAFIEKKRPNAMAIAILNFFAGWTIAGWIAALVWAYSNPDQKTRTSAAATSQRIPPAQDTKPCPFCAETIRAAAIKCRHCGSALNP